MEPKINSKEELTSYLNSIVIVLLFALCFGLPILFITITTDFFILPKQILTGGIVLIALVIFTFKMIVERAVRLRRTVFDLPLILVILSVSLSSFFAVNRFDSLISLVPFLFAILSFFIIVNFVRSKNSFSLLIGFLGAGAVATSIISLLSFFNIDLLPFPITQTHLDQAIYLGMLLPLAIFFAITSKSGQPSYNETIQTKNTLNIFKTVVPVAVSIILLVGFLVTIYQLFNPSTHSTGSGQAGSGQRLTILPFQTGFQTAMASISQDTGRPIQSFLFGSGFGTYITDFTRFKQATLNQNDALWGLTFVRSSSFVLEILATTGILGLLSFIFLIIRVVKALFVRGVLKTNPISISLLLSIVVLLILPVGFTIQVLFFILLALFSVFQKTSFDIELQLVALKKGLFNLETFTSPIPLHTTNHDQKDASRILPVIFAVIIFIFVGTLGFFSIRYLISDIEFQSSLVAASKNQGQQTYQKQSNAISVFPYRDGYYRVFSQTNLALANSLSSQLQTGSPSAQTQRTIYTLIQQSINAGRAATTIAPLTSLNWQNLSSIYRSLIGFGQNAENFAVVTQQQAILLDPNNPQGYIILGGIYYQLGLFENAQSQFQVAVNLKPNFANARYNLGHALENKGDLTNALRQYEMVKGLVSEDKNSLALIAREIEAIKGKIGEESTQAPDEQTTVPPSTTPSLNLSTPSAQLPPQNPPLKIPAPTTATESGR